MNNSTTHYVFIGILLCVCFVGCKEDIKPDAPLLQAPIDNSICLKGNQFTENTAELTFSWFPAKNAQYYVLVLNNLITKEKETFISYETSINVTLDANNSYSWNVLSMYEGISISSVIWKFYLTGDAISNYAPFPADLIYPLAGAIISSNGKDHLMITFQWRAFDPDNDIEAYAFYLDNTNASKLVLDSLSLAICNQNLQRGKTYFWKIVTTDQIGNTSESEVSSFSIN